MRYIKNYKLRIACLRCCTPSSVQSFFPYFFSPSSISRWCLDVYSNTEKDVNISQLVFSCEKSYFNSSTPLTGVSADPQRISLSSSATEVISKSWRWPRLVVRAEVKVGQSVSEPYKFWDINNGRKKSNCIESHLLPVRVFQAGERLLPCPHMWRNRGYFYPLQFASACNRRVWSCKVEILTIFIFILAANWYLCRC